jgi:hypothetical protein
LLSPTTVALRLATAPATIRRTTISSSLELLSQ